MKKQVLEKQILMNMIVADLDNTNKLAYTTRAELILGETSLPEYASYIRHCIKRLNILNKASESTILSPDFVSSFLKESEKLMAVLKQMKAGSGTKLDDTAEITCNSLISCFIKRYSPYVTSTEIDNALEV